MSREKLSVFEGNMNKALKSWHERGGREHFEPQLVEMPFEDLLRADERDAEKIAEIQQLHTAWQELQLSATALAEDSAATPAARRIAQKAADDFYEKHQGAFALLSDLDQATEVNDYEWAQRVIGVRLVFRWILAEGFRPLKIMKRLYAIGRAMGIPPFTQLTMEEQAKMFSETKAAVSFRLQVLSGLIKLRGMMGSRLPGQKTPASRASYCAAQEGNDNRAKGIAKRKARPRQSSFLRTLHVPTTKQKPK